MVSGVDYALALTFDRLFASCEERRRAVDRADALCRRHGAGGAAQVLRDKLRHPARRRSRRELRLALLAVRRG